MEFKMSEATKAAVEYFLNHVEYGNTTSLLIKTYKDQSAYYRMVGNKEEAEKCLIQAAYYEEEHKKAVKDIHEFLKNSLVVGKSLTEHLESYMTEYTKEETKDILKEETKNG